MKAKRTPDSRLEALVNRMFDKSLQMAFILGVGKKTADQSQGRFAANFGFFIQP